MTDCIKAKRTSRFKKWSLQQKIVLSITTVIFALYSLTLVYPFVYTFINSLKDEMSLFNEPFALPKTLEWSNYSRALELKIRKTGLAGMFFNSLWQTAMSSIVGLLASAVTAYVCARFDFKFLKVIYAIGVTVMVIPIVGNTAAMYKLLYSTGIADKPFLIWVIWAGPFGFAYMVLYSFFKTVSRTYSEAAMIDGAGHLRVFVQIVMPQALPAVSSMVIISAIGAWNDYMTPYLYLPSYPNIAVGLYELSSSTRWAPGGTPVFYALMLISLVPIIVIFIAFQKIILSNVSIGGLKG